MDNSRLVYSTKTGKICPSCEKPFAEYTCKKESSSEKESNCYKKQDNQGKKTSDEEEGDKKIKIAASKDIQTGGN